MAATIRVMARAVAKPGHEDALAAELLKLLTPTRAEPGCLRYEVLRSQSTPVEFVTVEEWVDTAAVEAHMASAHVQALFQAIPDYLQSSPSIQTFDSLN